MPTFAPHGGLIEIAREGRMLRVVAGGATNAEAMQLFVASLRRWAETMRSEPWASLGIVDPDGALLTPEPRLSTSRACTNSRPQDGWRWPWCARHSPAARSSGASGNASSRTASVSLRCSRTRPRHGNRSSSACGRMVSTRRRCRLEFRPRPVSAEQARGPKL